MEEGQRLGASKPSESGLYCLNPCCNGRGAKTSYFYKVYNQGCNVLILVVMEEGQRQFEKSELND